jgi:hypothetical protein
MIAMPRTAQFSQRQRRLSSAARPCRQSRNWRTDSPWSHTRWGGGCRHWAADDLVFEIGEAPDQLQARAEAPGQLQLGAPALHLAELDRKARIGRVGDGEVGLRDLEHGPGDRRGPAEQIHACARLILRAARRLEGRAVRGHADQLLKGFGVAGVKRHIGPDRPASPAHPRNRPPTDCAG